MTNDSYYELKTTKSQIEDYYAEEELLDDQVWNWCENNKNLSCMIKIHI